MSIPKILITLGIILIGVGLVWPLLEKSGLGRLPGDIAVEKDGFRFYFPITTSIIISLVLSLIFYFFRR
jgi:ribose/xylose/arabinose/galactoside ABC-type transport system permease subunit